MQGDSPSLSSPGLLPQGHKVVGLLGDLVRRQGWISGAFLILATTYTMYFARALLLPVFLAVLLSILLGPFVRALNRLMVPKALGAALVLLSIVTLLGVAVVEVSAPAGAWIERGPALKAELETKIRALRVPLAKAKEVTENLEDMASVGATTTPTVVVEGPSLMQRIFAEAQNAVVNIVVVVVLVYFLLARGDASYARLLATIRDPERRAIWKQAVDDIQTSIATYLLTVAVINTGLGALTALAMLLLGMPNPALWGVLAGVLNFIPYAGALVTLGVISMVSLLTFDQWGAILLPPLVFLLLTGFEGQIVSPLVVGKRLTLEPVAVFLSVLFWGWLWGLAGMLLAVPILASIKIAVNAVQPLHPFGALIGDDDPDEREPHAIERA
jgi:predicted PurR-regulated permease PerM